jgi:DNA ligase-1
MTTIAFKPLLASQVDDLSGIKYPVYASYKLDGIRCVIFNGTAYSRSMKPIPNKQIQQWAMDNALALEGVDGEFIVGSPTSETVFRDTTSFVMSHDKVENFSLYAFDVVYAEKPFKERLIALEQKVLPSDTKVLDQHLIGSSVDLERFRTLAVEQGYEGAMVRSVEGKYKQGRSSVKEGILLKMKLFKDAEFEVVGYECKYHNTNEATTNELGRTARSTSKAGLVAMDTLGVLYLRTPEGKEFGCGSGYDDKTRDELWAVRESLIGQLATVKYFDVGGYDVPRFGVFKGIRSVIDTGE